MYLGCTLPRVPNFSFWKRDHLKKNAYGLVGSISSLIISLIYPTHRSKSGKWRFRLGSPNSSDCYWVGGRSTVNILVPKHDIQWSLRNNSSPIIRYLFNTCPRIMDVLDEKMSSAENPSWHSGRRLEGLIAQPTTRHQKNHEGGGCDFPMISSYLSRCWYIYIYMISEFIYELIWFDILWNFALFLQLQWVAAKPSISFRTWIITICGMILACRIHPETWWRKKSQGQPPAWDVQNLGK